jgi:hypothetical protein
MSTPPRDDLSPPQQAGPLSTYAVPPPPEAGEMLYVFRTDITRLRAAILRQRAAPTSDFSTAAWGAIGASLSAGVGLIAFYASKPRPASWEALIFWCVFIAGLAAAIACFVAAHYLKKSQAFLQSEVIEELNRLEYGRLADATQITTTAVEDPGAVTAPV